MSQTFPPTPPAGESKDDGPLVFFINGKEHSIPSGAVEPHMLLFDYIHEKTKFKGTKLGCGEGGCGACAVSVSFWDGEKIVNTSANSCLKPLAACAGLSITTVEGLGQAHPVQDRLAKMHGSQCGYCTPGMVISIYSALKNKPDITEQQMEGCLDGNICRCTGYRPILDAAKSFASDSTTVDHMRGEVKAGGYDCAKIDPAFPEALKKANPSLSFAGWAKATSLAEVEKHASAGRVRFVVGDTCKGVYKNEGMETKRVDVREVPELQAITDSADGLTIGAARTLSELIELLDARSADSMTFGPIAAHVRKIANTHVRNAASIGGNLVMAKTRGFLSDLAPILQGAGATVTVRDAAGDAPRTADLGDFLSKQTEDNFLVLSVTLPKFSADQAFSTYRSAIRPINCHAILNAALFAEAKTGAIKGARLVFNGVMQANGMEDAVFAHPVRAKATEAYLEGKAVDNATLAGALATLSAELDPQLEATAAQAPTFTDKPHSLLSKKALARAFFTKWFVSLGEASTAMACAARDLSNKGCVVGKQAFPAVADDNTKIGKPFPNFTAKLQAEGKATYVGDINHEMGSGVGYVVIATQANAKVASIDASKALAAQGVMGWVDASSVKGSKSGSALGEPYPYPAAAFPVYSAPWIFVPIGERVAFYGQMIGMVVADTRGNAAAAAKLVAVAYDDVQAPILTIEESLAKSPGGPCPDMAAFGLPTQAAMKTGEPEEALKKAEAKVEGKTAIGSQLHFYMETHSAYAHFSEGGVLQIHSSTQWPTAVQDVVCSATGLSAHKVNVICRRLGGAYGGKLTGAVIPAAACAVAAQALGMAVSLQLDRNSDAYMTGGREECSGNYEAAYDPATGLVDAVNFDNMMTSGHCVQLGWFANVSYCSAISEAYGFKNFACTSKMVFTHRSPRSAVRGPGEMEAVVAVETMIEHVAHAAGLDAHEVRKKNILRHPGQEAMSLDEIAALPLLADDDAEKCGKIPGKGAAATCFTVPKMWAELEKSCDYYKRAEEIKAFNAANIAKKRGIAMVPIRYGVNVWKKSALVLVYKDGSVMIHSGTAQMGQGSNIKIAAAASSVLSTLTGDQLALDSFEFSRFESGVLSSQTFTGGSTGSEGGALAVMAACRKLVESFKPVMEGLVKAAEAKDDSPAVTFSAVCAAAEKAGKPMQFLGDTSECPQMPLAYFCYGVGCSEVELDTLTGEVTIARSDILYDAAKSLNPMVDIGQAEGGFIMGAGFLLQEEVCYDTKTGQLLGHGTWEYKPPMAVNVPRIFNVSLIKNEAAKNNVLSSKASGEPPLVLSSSIFCALRQAIASVRADAGMSEFFRLDAPTTTETILSLVAPAVAKCEGFVKACK